MKEDSLKKEIEKFQNEKVEVIKQSLRTKIRNQNDVHVLIEKVEEVNADGLKKIQFDLKNEFDNLYFVAATISNGKPLISVILSENIVKDKKLHAGNLVKELAKAIKGGGGGQKNLATAGGQDVSNLKEVIEKVKSLL